jgi:hypothetical protein
MAETLLARYRVCKLEPPGGCGDVAAQEAGSHEKRKGTRKMTIQAASHGEFDQPKKKSGYDR